MMFSLAGRTALVTGASGGIGGAIAKALAAQGARVALSGTRLDALERGAAEYLREPPTGARREEWFGWRPMTYDGKPIIDRSPALANVLIAAGHNMLGLSMAPATGKLVAEVLDGQTPHVDPARIAELVRAIVRAVRA